MEKQQQEKDEDTKAEKEEKEKREENEIKSEEEDVDRETFVAFARVFSGTLKKGAKLYVLGPKYDPALKHVELPER